MRQRLAALLLMSAGTTCGGGGGADPVGPAPLVADPAVLTGCLTDPVAAGTVRAKVVTCAGELIPGRLAAGRVGDFLIENAKIRVIVRGAGEGFYLPGTSGGGLIDAARVGAEDQIKEIQPIVDLNVGAYDELVITEAGDDGPAEIVVRGRAALVPLLEAAIGGAPIPAIIEHHWILAADDDALLMRTVIYDIPGEARDEGTHTLQEALFFGGRVTPFVPGTGFTEGGTSNGAFLASRGTGANTSYALVYRRGDIAAAQFLDIGGIRLAFGPTIDTTDTPSRDRWLVVGDGSVASLTERAWELRNTSTGTVAGATSPSVEIVVVDDAGDPITRGRADASGQYRVALPPGDYVLHAEHPGRTLGVNVPVTVTAGVQTAADVPAGPSGEIVISVRDPGAAPLPARVKIEDATGRRITWAGASGDVTIPVPPGTYRVSVSRGLEYDAFVADPVVVADDGSVSLAVVLTRVLDTAGWIALDTHLHSEMSTDSTMPLDERLLAVAGEGVELPISTDHDFITDYRSVIDELGLGAWVGSAIGEEASSVVWGHLNSWPLVVDEARAAHGAVHWYDRTPGEVFDLLRLAGPAVIVQVNHPRSTSSGLFTAIQFDPELLEARRDPTELGLPAGADLNDFSFDAIEVANGLTEEEFEEGLVDWLALVSAGHPAAATGSSDSHGASAFAGESRTYVYVGVGADDPTTVDIDVVNEAIRARHVVVSQSAFIEAGILNPATGLYSIPGDTVTLGAGTQVTMHIRVQAPPWQPLARIRVYERSVVVRDLVLDSTETAVVRYDADITLPAPTGPTFFVVRVDPAGPGDPVLGDSVGSFTNPLFVE